LIAAEPLITEQVPEVRMIIAGAGENLDHYREMMVNKDRFLVYNGYLAREMVAALFQMASIVVLPYREATQSSVLNTAFVFGKPVVATSVGSIPEYVEDGVTGYLVPPNDVGKLAEAIIRLLQDDSLRHEMGQKAYEKAEGTLSPASVAGQTEQLYNNVLQELGLVRIESFSGPAA
jgi:glycosyltransferase involved in cell wall biosynthesis